MEQNDRSFALVRKTFHQVASIQVASINDNKRFGGRRQAGLSIKIPYFYPLIKIKFFYSFLLTTAFLYANLLENWGPVSRTGFM